MAPATSKTATRKFRRLSNRQVLALFKRGVYELTWRGELAYVRNAAGRELAITLDKQGYRFVRLYAGRRRRAVPTHVLAWMLAHERVLPRGCQVHHRQGKRRERPHDLELLTHDEHAEVHRGWE